MKAPLADRLLLIDALVLDVDGVMTDGSVIYTDAGAEVQAFHVRDGSGLSFWHSAGKRAAVVTGRGSKALERRAAELHLDPVVQQARNKRAGFAQVVTALGLPLERIAVVADDLPDLPMMRPVGVSFAVADAVAEVKAAADVVTMNPGGRGAIREVVECILKAQERWSELLRHFD